MTLALAIAGIAALLSSIALHRARLANPDFDRLDFGTPVRDAFLNVLAWASLVCVVMLAIQQRGVLLPLLALVLFGLAIWFAQRRLALKPLYRYANFLAITGPVFVLVLLQQISNSIPVIDLTSMILGMPSRVPSHL